MSDEAVKQVLQRVDALALKLNVTAAHLWQVLVYQAHIQAIKSTLLIAILLVLPIYYLSTLKAKIGEYESLRKCSIRVGFFDAYFWFGGALSLVCTVGVILEMLTLINAALNPEYWALQQLLNM